MIFGLTLQAAKWAQVFPLISFALKSALKAINFSTIPETWLSQAK